MTKLVFDGQREGEEVKFVFRRHFSTAKAGIIFLVIMMLLGVVPLFLWQNDLRMLWLFLFLYDVVFFGLYCDGSEDKTNFTERFV